jgi:hypothetical protein
MASNPAMLGAAELFHDPWSRDVKESCIRDTGQHTSKGPMTSSPMASNPAIYICTESNTSGTYSRPFIGPAIINHDSYHCKFKSVTYKLLVVQYSTVTISL